MSYDRKVYNHYAEFNVVIGLLDELDQSYHVALIYVLVARFNLLTLGLAGDIFSVPLYSLVDHRVSTSPKPIHFFKGKPAA